MEARPQEIYFLEAGGVDVWLDKLEDTDEAAHDAIVARLERVEDGNFGDSGPAGSVKELRFHIGPGYRLYFGQHEDIVILLRAGIKKTQNADIKIAEKLWSDYKDGK
jgi:putative addiction module killer protein